MKSARLPFLSTWFFASLLWLVLAFTGLVLGRLFFTLPAFAMAGWCFMVWTIAIGVRVGQRV
jgi:hypothetical protein